MLKYTEHLHQEQLLDQDQLIIQSTVNKYLGKLAFYLATKYGNKYPNVCFNACNSLQEAVKRNANIDLTLCEGECHSPEGWHCGYHVWLEHGNIIIDPTDYQFHIKEYPVIEMDVLTQDLIQEGYDINAPSGTYSIEELKKAYSEARRKRNNQRYLENPNDKEKYFQELTKLLINEQINEDLFVDETQRCFRSKVFYDKTDSNSDIVYDQIN